MSTDTKQSEPEKDTLPALYEHCCSVYGEMLRQAHKQEYQEDGETKYAIVYEGFLTKLITEDLHLATPYYTSTRDALKKMGCIQQLRRGGSTSQSQWRLFHEPTETLFRKEVHKPKRGSRSQYDHRMNQMEDMLATLNRQVQEHERLLTNLRQEEQVQ